MNKLLVLNGGASVKPGNKSAFLKFDDPIAAFEKTDINTGDVLVYDAILKILSYDSIQNIQFDYIAQQGLWPSDSPSATVIRGSNYLSEAVDLGSAVPLLKKLNGPIVAIGVGAQAATYKKLKFTEGTLEAWRIIASKCETIGVRGAYSAEVFNDIGIKNVRVIGCPSFYRSGQPSIAIKKIDPASAIVGLTLNRYLSKDYATNAVKTNRMQRALLDAVARRPQSRLYSQGEREESLAVYSLRQQRAAYVDAILDGYCLKENAACQALLTDRMFAFLDVDEWARDVLEKVDVMVGFRLHGNVIALHQGIPAVFFTYDSRIRELATLFAAPSIEVEDYRPIDLDRIFSNMDFHAMERAYRGNFAEFFQFLTENGLRHCLPTPEVQSRGEPLSALNIIKTDCSTQQTEDWFRGEIDHLSQENQDLRTRAWNLEQSLRERSTAKVSQTGVSVYPISTGIVNSDSTAKNTLHLTARASGRSIEYDYQISGPWCEAFNVDGISGWFAEVGKGVHKFFVEYQDEIADVPASISVIPFLCNALPIAWLYDAAIYVDEIDAEFLESIARVKQAYAHMYPKHSFGGTIVTDKVVENKLYSPQSPPLVLFSGGVDAVFTMLGNRALRPTLLTVWGADLFFKHEKAWATVKEQNERLAQAWGCDFTTISSSFRLFINYSVLDEKFAKPYQDDWWHGFQHGIGLLGLTAPLAWVRRADHIVISSSYSASDPFFTRCASDPSIDAALRFFGATCRHFDYTVTRQNKVAFICGEAEAFSRSLPLRVCWETATGSNCCLCDKCMRTIFGIYGEGADPVRFGFSLNDEKLEEITRKLKSGGVKPTAFWFDIVGRLRAREDKWRGVPHVAALLDLFPVRRAAS